MIKSQDKVLLLMKKNAWTDMALTYFKTIFEHLTVIEASERETPELISRWRQFDDYPDLDWIISFVCQWVIPPEILKLAKKGAINFHPGPPEYPGTGCYNFAIFNGTEEYGVTCHYMIESVDAGPIIRVHRFKIPPYINVIGLKSITMAHLMGLLYEIVGIIWAERHFILNGEKWSRKAYTRKDFQELCEIKLPLTYHTNFTPDSLENRLRATYFPNAPDGPYIKVQGKKWRLIPE